MPACTVYKPSKLLSLWVLYTEVISDGNVGMHEHNWGSSRLGSFPNLNLAWERAVSRYVCLRYGRVYLPSVPSTYQLAPWFVRFDNGPDVCQAMELFIEIGCSYVQRRTGRCVQFIVQIFDNLSALPAIAQGQWWCVGSCIVVSGLV